MTAICKRKKHPCSTQGLKTLKPKAVVAKVGQTFSATDQNPPPKDIILPITTRRSQQTARSAQWPDHTCAQPRAPHQLPSCRCRCRYRH